MAATATSRLKTGACNRFPGGLVEGRVTGMVMVRDLQHALRRRGAGQNQSVNGLLAGRRGQVTDLTNGRQHPARADLSPTQT